MLLTPLVSIIIPTYNQANYISETLISVLAQTYKNWECIIVNDGSSDNTDEIVTEWHKKDKRFMYFIKSNEGVSSARNYGISKSSGYYILPLDSDDIISNDYLEKAISHFNKFPNTKLIYSDAEKFGKQSEKWDLGDYSFEELLFHNKIFCSAIYKKTDFDKTKGYNSKMNHGLEDWEFWVSFLDYDDIVYKIPDVCFYYRIKPLSRNKVCSEDLELKMMRQLVLNNFSKYLKFFPDIIYLKNEFEKQIPIIESLNDELNCIKKSNSYKLACIISNQTNKLTILFKNVCLTLKNLLRNKK